LFAANLIAGHLNDANGASAANPGGYSSMLWFFALLSLAAFACTVPLWVRDPGSRTLPEASGAAS
jgi:hypothetical protein